MNSECKIKANLRKCGNRHSNGQIHRRKHNIPTVNITVNTNELQMLNIYLHCLSLIFSTAKKQMCVFYNVFMCSQPLSCSSAPFSSTVFCKQQIHTNCLKATSLTFPIFSPFKFRLHFHTWHIVFPKGQRQKPIPCVVGDVQQGLCRMCCLS